MRKPKPNRPIELGATGRYPMGAVGPHDEGELMLGIAVASGRVLVNFGTPVHSLGLDAGQAEALAQILIQRAKEAREQCERMMLLKAQG